jgi:hypothetical protein
MLLDGWDGELTPPDRKQIDRHIDQCDVCADRIEGALRPAMQHGMVPLFGPPLELRDEVLQLCTSSSPGALAYRRDVTQRAGPFRENGFPEPIRPPKRRVLALSGMTAAVAGVVIAITATGIVAAIALTGGHPKHPATAAAQSSQSSGAAATGTLPTSTGPSGGLPIGAEPTTSVTATASAAPPAPAPSSTASARAKPSPSHPATSAAPTLTRPTFTYSPTATPTVSPPSPGTTTTGPGG